MPILEVELTVRQDGVPVAGYPLKRRISVDEIEGFDIEKADDNGSFSNVFGGQLGEVQVLLLRSTKQITLRLDAQSDAGIVINANGLLLAFDVDVDAGAATNTTVSNDSGETANLRGLVGGT